MRDLNNLYYFVQVVDHGGFAPAGRALGEPKSKLSRRVAQLEEELGVRLIHRSTRQFALTEVGEAFLRHCRAMLAEAEAAREVIERTRSEPQGLLRLSCPTALLDHQVGDMLARFMAANPRVQMHLVSTNRRMDVIREGLDVALRVRFPPLEDTELVLKVLGESTQRLVASPEFVSRYGAIRTPADLADLPSLDQEVAGGDHVWELQAKDGAQARVRHQPVLVSDDRQAQRLAALRGVGGAGLPTMMVHDELAAGRLIDVLPDWRPRPAVVHAVFSSRRGLLPSVRGLLDFLADEFQALAQIVDPPAQATLQAGDAVTDAPAPTARETPKRRARAPALP